MAAFGPPFFWDPVHWLPDAKPLALGATCVYREWLRGLTEP